MVIPNMILKNRSLNFIAAAMIVVAILIPLLNIMVITPRFNAQVISYSERDALRMSNHLSEIILDHNGVLNPELSDVMIRTQLEKIIHDFHILKIKIFSDQGLIIYSSQQSEIGSQNTHDYFQDIIAQGNRFSKVVKKESANEEGEYLSQDVVETYVPIMSETNFTGAIELYYDVSDQIDSLRTVSRISTYLPLTIMLGFLLLTLFVTKRLDRIITKRQQEELDLSIRHNDLENVFKSVEKAKKEWEHTMDCMSEMVILCSQAGIIKRTNRAFIEFTNTPYAGVLGHTWQEVFSHHQLLPANFPADSDITIHHRESGRSFNLKGYPFSETNENSSGGGLVITITDITRLTEISKKLEQQNQIIEENRQNLQEALDKISLIIHKVASEQDFSIRFGNPHVPTCSEIMDCQKKSCPCFGKNMRCWQEVGTLCRGEIQGAFAHKRDNCLECKVFKASTTDPIFLIGEEFNNMMHILAGKNSQLQEAYEQLKASQSQLLQQEKMASIGQLAAGVAHEINNPMGFISSNFTTLKKYCDRLEEFIQAQDHLTKGLGATAEITELDTLRKNLKIDYIMEDLRDLIAESQEGAERVKNIVMGLKNFSRVDQAELQQANLNECLESTLNVVWNELKYKATVVKEFGELPVTLCHPQQLNQVFVNLLVNAAQAIEKQGVITVKTQCHDGMIEISVSDTGRGIQARHLNRLFEPFFTTKEVGKGTGLGLSITYDIVKKHGGDIVVDTELGKGSTFTVRLPVKDQPDLQAKTEGEPEAEPNG
ncbi:MAG: GHKL domain-containing protein [Proteobacteria bacterium]|nr:GHKL domain-containing protein [Pseudomonadota bacterium]MBU1688430.1 GHKL domain-containing protein [Pseudomonadota bacterium]